MKNINFRGGLTNATQKIAAFCMETNSSVQTNIIDVLAAVLTYLKQKKKNVIEGIIKKFDDMPDDFEAE